MAQNKWIEAISALNEMTQVGELRWSTTTNPVKSIKGAGLLASLSLREPIGAAFVATYEGKVLRLYSYKHSSSNALSMGAGPQYTLEILDDATKDVLVTVPETGGLKDLYQSIHYQISDVDTLLTSLINRGSKRI